MATSPPPPPEDAVIPAVPVEALGKPVVSARDEETSLEGKAKQLDLNLRSWAGYGALAIAATSYLAGFAAIALFLGLCPHYPKMPPDGWHIVVAVLVALFSVPTVLVLAVLRNAATSQKAAGADSIHEALGQSVLSFIEKLAKLGGK